jgi:hypothetical protein
MIPVNMQGSLPATRFVPPAGEYYLEVASCEIATNKDGQGQRLSVKNRILMGPGTSTEFQGKFVYSSYNLDHKQRDYLHTFLVACGLWTLVEQNQGAVDSDWFTGKQYKCRIRINKDGYPNVSDEISPTATAPNTQSMPQTAAQPGFLQPITPMPQMQQYQQQAPQQMSPQQFQQAPQQYAAPPQQQMPQQQQQQQYAAPPQQQGFPPQQQFQQMPQQGGNGQSMPNVPPPPQQFQAPPPPPGFAGQK